MSGLFNDDTLSLYLKLKEAMKQYVRDAMPGGALNREIKPQDTLDAAALSLSPVPLVGDAAGLLADGYRYATDPSSRTPLNYGLSALGALPFVPAMGAVTAWHGSPHKFDKFDMSKIGTGEGAQAYGHGLYLAEAPGVAKQYADTLSSYHIATKDGVKGGGDFADALVANAGEYPSSLSSAIRSQANKIATDLANGKPAEQIVSAMRNGPYARIYSGLADAVENLSPSKAVGSLYKVDIPDEAVARFLDWDKPLSEQANVLGSLLSDVNSINTVSAQKIRNLADSPGLADWAKSDLLKDAAEVERSNSPAHIAGVLKRMQMEYGITPDHGPFKDQAQSFLDFVKGMQAVPNMDTGGGAVSYLNARYGQTKASDLMRDAGIPGIRYLDGGSRGAGSGTSNFVVFDPDMIRILERNGEATGAKPWQPGEWEGLFKK